MSKNLPQIHSTFDRNVTSADIAANIDVDAMHDEIVAAAQEFAPLHSMEPELAKAATEHFERLGSFVAERMQEFADEHDMTDAQLTGMHQSFAYGMIVDTVDRMRHDSHPLLRGVYLSTVLRIMQYNTVAGTAMQYAKDTDMEAARHNARLVNHATLDKAPPMKMLRESLDAGVARVNEDRADAEASAAPVTEAEIKGDIVAALNRLVDLLPPDAQTRIKDRFGELLTNGPTPAPEPAKVARLDKAAALKAFDDLEPCPRHGDACPTRKRVRDLLLDDEGVEKSGMIEVDGDIDDPDVQAAIAKQLSEATGANVTVDDVRKAMRNGVGVINLSKRGD